VTSQIRKPLDPQSHKARLLTKLGIAIARSFFPTWLSPTFTETYLLACLLHDIGTTDSNITATLMSFEFYGGMIALDVLAKEGAPKAQAESVAEAVFRHQDLGDEGTLTTVGALIQLGTIFGELFS
jgi:cyanamide hydratase